MLSRGIPCHRKYSGQHNQCDIYMYTWHTMERLDEIQSNIQWLSRILIGCVFYGMVQLLKINVDVHLDEL